MFCNDVRDNQSRISPWRCSALAACLSAEDPKPVLHYSFDPPTEETVRDVAGKIDDQIEGNFKSMPGPVGAALKPDGYTTRIVRPAEKAPALKAGFSVEAWVAHAAYPWNWCPVLSQRDGEEKGYYFAVGPRGDVALELAVDGEWRQCVSRTRRGSAAPVDPRRGDVRSGPRRRALRQRQRGRSAGDRRRGRLGRRGGDGLADEPREAQALGHPPPVRHVARLLQHRRSRGRDQALRRGPFGRTDRRGRPTAERSCQARRCR